MTTTTEVSILQHLQTMWERLESDLPLMPPQIIVRQPQVTQVPLKTHRKKRIRNKWRNRYGTSAVVAPYDPREILRTESLLLVYPEMAAQVRAALDS